MIKKVLFIIILLILSLRAEAVTVLGQIQQNDVDGDWRIGLTVTVLTGTRAGTTYTAPSSAISVAFSGGKTLFSSNTANWNPAYAPQLNDQIHVVITRSDGGKYYYVDSTKSYSSTNLGIFNILERSLTVTSPNGGEQWPVGTSKNITWNAVGFGAVENVIIKLSRDGGTSWSNTATVTANLGSYSWTVTAPESANCLIRVCDALYPDSLYDQSDLTFQILSNNSITILSPDGGETWQAGTSNNITWSYQGNIADVKIELSSDGGSSYPVTIVASTTNNGSFTWPIPGTYSTGNNYRVKVSDTGGTASDTSDNNFTIQKLTTINVIEPAAGWNWEIGTTHNIKWTTSGAPISKVKIELSRDNGTTWPTTIVDGWSNGSPYSWTIPPGIQPSANCKIRISAR